MTQPALVPGTIGAHTSCLLVKLGQVAYRLEEVALAPLDLRVRHFSLLQGLADCGPIGQIDLVRYLRIDPATMAAALEHLEALGAVERERDANDRRRYVVALTSSGRDLLARADNALKQVDATLRADLSAPASAQLHDLLTEVSRSATLAEAFHGHRDDPNH